MLGSSLQVGQRVQSGARIRVLLQPVGPCPLDKFRAYASEIQSGFGVIDLANLTFQSPYKESPFRYLSWQRSKLRLEFVCDESMYFANSAGSAAAAAAASPVSSALDSKQQSLVALQSQQSQQPPQPSKGSMLGTYHQIDSEWFDLFVHRRMMGVIGICYCPAYTDLSVAYAEFQRTKKKMAGGTAAAAAASSTGAASAVGGSGGGTGVGPLRTKCYAFEPLETQPDPQLDDFILFPNQDINRIQFYLSTWINEFAAFLLDDFERFVKSLLQQLSKPGGGGGLLTLRSPLDDDASIAAHTQLAAIAKDQAAYALQQQTAAAAAAAATSATGAIGGASPISVLLSSGSGPASQVLGVAAPVGAGPNTAATTGGALAANTSGVNPSASGAASAGTTNAGAASNASAAAASSSASSSAASAVSSLLFKRTPIAGIGSAAPNYNKLRPGRTEKHLADYCLLAGSPLDAVRYYRTASELTKQHNDWVWYAAAIEGQAAALVSAEEEKTDVGTNSGPGGNSGPNAGGGGGGNAALTGSTGSGGGGSGGAEYVSSVSELYADACAAYLKTGAVGWSVYLALEANFKVLRYLGSFGRRLACVEVLQRIVDLTIDIPAVDATAVCIEAAIVCRDLGLSRKAGFFAQCAASLAGDTHQHTLAHTLYSIAAPAYRMNHLHDDLMFATATAQTVSGGSGDSKSASAAAAAALTPFESRPRSLLQQRERGWLGSVDPWLALQRPLLERLMSTAKRLSDTRACASATAHLLRGLYVWLDRECQRALCSELSACTRLLPINTPIDFNGLPILMSVTPVPLPTPMQPVLGGFAHLKTTATATAADATDATAASLAAALTSAAAASAASATAAAPAVDEKGAPLAIAVPDSAAAAAAPASAGADVFLFHPDRDGHSTTAAPRTYVCGETIDVEIELLNPLRVEFACQRVALSTSGTALFEAYPTAITLPPAVPMYQPQVMGDEYSTALVPAAGTPIRVLLSGKALSAGTLTIRGVHIRAFNVTCEHRVGGGANSILNRNATISIELANAALAMNGASSGAIATSGAASSSAASTAVGTGLGSSGRSVKPDRRSMPINDGWTTHIATVEPIVMDVLPPLPHCVLRYEWCAAGVSATNATATQPTDHNRNSGSGSGGGDGDRLLYGEQRSMEVVIENVGTRPVCDCEVRITPRFALNSLQSQNRYYVEGEFDQPQPTAAADDAANPAAAATATPTTGTGATAATPRAGDAATNTTAANLASPTPTRPAGSGSGPAAIDDNDASDESDGDDGGGDASDGSGDDAIRDLDGGGAEDPSVVDEKRELRAIERQSRRRNARKLKKKAAAAAAAADGAMEMGAVAAGAAVTDTPQPARTPMRATASTPVAATAADGETKAGDESTAAATDGTNADTSSDVKRPPPRRAKPKTKKPKSAAEAAAAAARMAALKADEHDARVASEAQRLVWWDAAAVAAQLPLLPGRSIRIRVHVNAQPQCCGADVAIHYCETKHGGGGLVTANLSIPIAAVAPPSAVASAAAPAIAAPSTAVAIVPPPPTTAAAAVPFAHRQIIQPIAWNVSAGLQLLSIDVWPFVPPAATATAARHSTRAPDLASFGIVPPTTTPAGAGAGSSGTARNNELGDQLRAARATTAPDEAAPCSEDDCMLIVEVANTASCSFRLFSASAAAPAADAAVAVVTPSTGGVLIESNCSKRVILPLKRFSFGAEEDMYLQRAAIEYRNQQRGITATARGGLSATAPAAAVVSPLRPVAPSPAHNTSGGAGAGAAVAGSSSRAAIPSTPPPTSRSILEPKSGAASPSPVASMSISSFLVSAATNAASPVGLSSPVAAAAAVAATGSMPNTPVPVTTVSLASSNASYGGAVASAAAMDADASARAARRAQRRAQRSSESLRFAQLVGGSFRRCRALFLSRLNLSWRSSDDSVGTLALSPGSTPPAVLNQVCSLLNPEKLYRVVVPDRLTMHVALSGQTARQVNAIVHARFHEHQHARWAVRTSAGGGGSIPVSPYAAGGGVLSPTPSTASTTTAAAPVTGVHSLTSDGFDATSLPAFIASKSQSTAATASVAAATSTQAATLVVVDTDSKSVAAVEPTSAPTNALLSPPAAAARASTNVGPSASLAPIRLSTTSRQSSHAGTGTGTGSGMIIITSPNPSVRSGADTMPGTTTTLHPPATATNGGSGDDTSSIVSFAQPHVSGGNCYRVGSFRTIAITVRNRSPAAAAGVGAVGGGAGDEPERWQLSITPYQYTANGAIDTTLHHKLVWTGALQVTSPKITATPKPKSSSRHRHRTSATSNGDRDDASLNAISVERSFTIEAF